MKELILRLDENTLARLETEVKQRRASGNSKSLSDIILIRLLESLGNNKRVLSVRLNKSSLVIRDYDTALPPKEV